MLLQLIAGTRLEKDKDNATEIDHLGGVGLLACKSAVRGCIH